MLEKLGIKFDAALVAPMRMSQIMREVAFEMQHNMEKQFLSTTIEDFDKSSVFKGILDYIEGEDGDKSES